MIKLKSPADGSVIDTDSSAVKDCFENYVPGYGMKYYGQGENLPMKSVRIEWEAGNAEAAEGFVVEISDNESFANAEKYFTTESFLELNGLIPNKKYFWRVSLKGESGEKIVSDAWSFETKGYVRSVPIDGVSNVRDLGGAVASDGKKIKYGVLFRSANGDSITEAGRKTIEKLGIKTDLDLRGEGAEVSPFGDNVKLIKISGAYYDSVPDGPGVNGSEEYRNNFRDELKVCADPDNYPMIFHCAIGRDRTGTLALILQALCGVEKESLLREYELSLLSVGGSFDNNRGMPQRVAVFYDFLDGLGGEELKNKSFKEKIEFLVKSLGVTDEEISSIRKILLQ